MGASHEQWSHLGLRDVGIVHKFFQNVRSSAHGGKGGSNA